ncbi:MAG: polyphosphate kinase 2 family protein [Pyrinomonadaceae bacterium]|nr:polyphosphate kinase 2 family protein [Pyrinomonadaceae bacterium]
MKIEKFQVPEGKELNLADHPTDFTGDYSGKEEAVKDLKANIEKLSELQSVLYAEDVHSILIIFQAMDAAGKDGAIKHVMSGLNPQGTQVFSFKQPSREELDHGYLWRCSKALPERGRIGIFNRSYYEDVLVVRVHPQILQIQQLPDEIKNDPNIWQQRFQQIKNFEQYLSENGIHVLKFFLNVSKEEQKARFLSRINTPDKNWKFSSSDVRERGFWDDYMHAYREAISATSTADSPWFIIPADKKWFSRLAVSEIIVQKMSELNMRYPELNEIHRQDLADAKKLLESEE